MGKRVDRRLNECECLRFKRKHDSASNPCADLKNLVEVLGAEGRRFFKEIIR